MDLDLGVDFLTYAELEKLVPPPNSALPLKNYQVGAVDNFISWRKAHPTHASVNEREAVITLSMGLGKTLIAAECIKAEVADGGQVLWITHRDELKDQTEKTLLRQAGISAITRVGKKSSGDVVICANSIQGGQIGKIKNKISPTLIVIDEAHHAYAETYSRLKREFPNAKILNLTATPYRMDIANELELGTKLSTMTPNEAIDLGHLVPFKTVERIEHEFVKAGLSKAAKSKGDYKLTGLSALMQTPEVMEKSIEAIVKHAKTPVDRRGLIYCCDKKHAGMVAKELTAKGIKTAIVLDETPLADRQKIYQDLKDGLIDQIVNVNILTEGFDLPETDMITILRPTRSAALYVQMLGRGLRLSPSTTKHDCIVIDAFDISKTKGRREGTQLPYPEEVSRYSAMEGSPKTAAALYLTWLYGDKDLTNPVNLYTTVTGIAPTPAKEKEIERALSAVLLGNTDGLDELAFALHCSGIEHLHKALCAKGYLYGPHDESPTGAVSLGVTTGTGSKRQTAKRRVGKASLTSNPIMKNLVLSLCDPKVNAIEKDSRAHIDSFMVPVDDTRDSLGNPVPKQTFWFKHGDFHYIPKPDFTRSAAYDNSFYVISPKGRVMVFQAFDPGYAGPEVLDPAKNAHIFTLPDGTSGTLRSLGEFKHYQMSERFNSRHKSDSALQEPATDSQRAKIKKEFGLNTRQAAELTITKGLASYVLDHAVPATLGILDHIAMRLPLVDAYFDAHPSKVRLSV